MEREIGEIFEFEGVKLQVVKSCNCGLHNVGCYFIDDDKNCRSQICYASKRKDKTPVKFIRIGD